MMLKQMKQKVLCSVCSALFRHDGTRQVVDLQGVFVLFLCLFHCSIYIYNLRRAKNRLTMLTSWRLSSLGLFGKSVKRVEQRNRHDNEARKHLISFNFFSKNDSGTSENILEQSRNKPQGDAQ
jgi:hypothetical protein